MDALVTRRWIEHAERAPEREAVVHWVAGEEPVRWRWGELLSRACGLAGALSASGVRAGEVCALLVRHHRDVYPLYIAVALLGALPAVLAYPNDRLHPEKFRHGLRGMAARSGLAWVLTERALEPVVGPLVGGEGSTLRGALFPLEWPDAAGPLPGGWAEARAGSPFLLQHSSGTTGLQKAVVLSHRAILEHVERYARAIDLSTRDRVISWLPLYHDMGLIAALQMPLAFGVPLVQMSPFEWVAAPVLLLDALGREGGTISWLPNFAYNLMAERAHEDDLEGLRLDHVRMLINCSEPVRADSHERFARRFAPYGLRREALSACYAMAEATFAVTQTAPGAEARRVVVDREALAQGQAALVAEGAPGRACVSSGRPIAGCELRVVDEAGSALDEGRVGEILVRSVSLFDGYRNDPERTAEVLRDGWYLTRDLGFLHQGEIYVVGRQKDLIIVAGKNLYPEDIEDALASVEGVLPGRAVAFGLEDEQAGTEVVAVVVESDRADPADRAKLGRAIQQAGMAIDVTISKVFVAPPRWLIKSSAGKPSRKDNKERAVRELSPVG